MQNYVKNNQFVIIVNLSNITMTVTAAKTARMLADYSSLCCHLATRAFPGAKYDAVQSSPREGRRSGGDRRGGEGGRSAAAVAAMASVTGHCIWFHAKWALSYSWVEIVKISRGYPPLNWIAATCVYPLSSCSRSLSVSLSLTLCVFFSLTSRSLSRPPQLRRLFRLYSRALVNVVTIADEEKLSAKSP